MASFLLYTTENGEEWDSVPVLECGEVYSYTIPGFSVITVSLRRLRYQCIMPDQSIKVVDGFVRDDPSLQRVYPAEMMVEMSCENACIVKVGRLC